MVSIVMKTSPRLNLHAGRRVEIPAYLDIWKRGHKFGRIKFCKSWYSVRDHRVITYARVQLDNPPLRVKDVIAPLEDCKLLEEQADGR